MHAEVFAVAPNEDSYKSESKYSGEDPVACGDVFHRVYCYKFRLPARGKKLLFVMKEQLNSVKRFHEVFGVPIRNEPGWPLNPEEVKLRFKLMKEENEEYAQAAAQKDLPEVADALGDMLYILCGTILSHGMQDIIEEVFSEIQRSNMSKLGPDGQPIYREDGKVMKGPDYFRPNIEGILNK